MPSYKLTYFSTTGAAEHIRYIFAYAGQAYEDVRVKYEDWPALKPTTPFGRLPLLEIDGKVFSQTMAIARYLAKQYGLTGKDEWEALQAEVLVDTLGDFRQIVQRTFLETDEKKKKEIAKELSETHIPFYFGKFEKIVASNPSGLLVGSEVTWADLTFAAKLSNFLEKQPSILKPYPALTELVNKVHSIPRIKAWLEKRPADVPRPT